MIIINVSGPTGGGKGHAIALIAKALRDQGIQVNVQCEETGHEDKFQQATEVHVEKLKNRKIMITELRTGV